MKKKVDELNEQSASAAVLEMKSYSDFVNDFERKKNEKFIADFSKALDAWFKYHTNVKNIAWDYEMNSDDEGGAYPSLTGTRLDFGNHEDVNYEVNWIHPYNNTSHNWTESLQESITEGLLEWAGSYSEEIKDNFCEYRSKMSIMENPYYVAAEENDEQV